MPESVHALEADGHQMVGFYAPDAPEVAPFNFLIDGKSRRLSRAVALIDAMPRGSRKPNGGGKGRTGRP
jgi:hypothetical protein